MSKVIPFNTRVAALCAGVGAGTMTAVLPLFPEETPLTSENESVNRFPDRLDILECCIDGAEEFGNPFLEKRRSEAMAYYRVGAEYLGGAMGEAGRIHIILLSYIRSGPRDSLLWGRRHNFVVFLDAEFTMQAFWRFHANTHRLAMVENRLCWNGGSVFDFSQNPDGENILVDGELYPPPQ